MTLYVPFLTAHVCRYRSYPADPPARLTAGVPVSIHTTEPVEDLSPLRLIPPHVRDSIVQVLCECMIATVGTIALQAHIILIAGLVISFMWMLL